MLQLETLRPLRILSGGFIAIICLASVIFESLNLLSKRKAAAHLKKDEDKYDELWSNFSRNTSVHPAQTLSDEIATSFTKVLENPDVSSRSFIWQLRVLQEHSNVDNLFDDVELVDVAFQQLMHCWLSVSFSVNFATAFRLRAKTDICRRAAMKKNWGDLFNMKTWRPSNSCFLTRTAFQLPSVPAPSSK
jgi:hypothetical protein